mmetsp:Transcript_32348/g.103834  ORF Transcript_32348/g.103834 Transcript_32348/m.103834 type:complete len:343 (+) Transcript_32348:590-1618(+)
MFVSVPTGVDRIPCATITTPTEPRRAARARGSLATTDTRACLTRLLVVLVVQRPSEHNTALVKLERAAQAQPPISRDASLASLQSRRRHSPPNLGPLGDPRGEKRRAAALCGCGEVVESPAEEERCVCPLGARQVAALQRVLEQLEQPIPVGGRRLRLGGPRTQTRRRRRVHAQLVCQRLELPPRLDLQRGGLGGAEREQRPLRVEGVAERLGGEVVERASHQGHHVRLRLAAEKRRPCRKVRRSRLPALCRPRVQERPQRRGDDSVAPRRRGERVDLQEAAEPPRARQPTQRREKEARVEDEPSEGRAELSDHRLLLHDTAAVGAKRPRGREHPVRSQRQP